jgi:molecular chaperone GrpE (heat shock protein)
MNQQNLQQVSYVHELLRCLNSLDAEAHYRLIEELQKDLLQRQSYLQYLVRLRQDLLSTIATIDNFQKRLQNDRDMINRHLVMVCVKMFMERRESILKVFQEDFNLKPAADEKLELMEEFIGRLMDDLKLDNISQGMNEWQLIEARNCIEKILLQRLYHQVMFPNDDVDVSNDQ